MVPNQNYLAPRCIVQCFYYYYTLFDQLLFFFKIYLLYFDQISKLYNIRQCLPPGDPRILRAYESRHGSVMAQSQGPGGTVMFRCGKVLSEE